MGDSWNEDGQMGLSEFWKTKVTLWWLGLALSLYKKVMGSVPRLVVSSSNLSVGPYRVESALAGLEGRREKFGGELHFGPPVLRVRPGDGVVSEATGPRVWPSGHHR